jgi:type IV pilus assembly protein PilV
MNKRFQPPGDMGARQSGVLLLEALIAILIFSLGVLTVIGLQAASIRMAAEAQMRTKAVLLADRLVGQMWASGYDIPTLKANFDSPSGADYADWLTSVQDVENGGLPGVAGTALPTVVVTSLPGDVTDGVVTITLKWKTPTMDASDPPRQHVVTSQISRNE